MIASDRKSTQVHATPGQTESQEDPSFQLVSNCDAVWPELKDNDGGLEVAPFSKELSQVILSHFGHLPIHLKLKKT